MLDHARGDVDFPERSFDSVLSVLKNKGFYEEIDNENSLLDMVTEYRLSPSKG
jgi:hypothetical protein